MKLKKNLLLALIIFLLSNLQAQEIEIIVHENFIYAPQNTLELVFDFEVINISDTEQTIFEVRTINNIPQNWTSSLCFGELCFAPEIDSVATAPPLPDPPLQPGDTLITSLHVFTDQISIGTANVQLKVGTTNNPNSAVLIDFVATTDPTVNVKDEEIPNAYFLSQNYPNPFNPVTVINYGLKEEGTVTLKIYNILGAEITTLVDEYKPAGTYRALLDASKYSSGIYIYRLTVNGFIHTKKMILEK